MVLETDDLRLISPDLSLASALTDYWRRNRAFLAPYEPQRSEEFFTPSHQADILREEIEREQADTGYRFYITRKEIPGEIIGSIGLSNVVRGAFHSCFMGYQLDEAYLNRGYMTQTVNRVVEYAFRELHLHRIEGNIMPRNQRSIRVVEKCGFTKEGISSAYLNINGVWEDHIHMVKLNPDW
jgi:ribosomal-protein-alanine N-acetyltransferase